MDDDEEDYFLTSNIIQSEYPDIQTQHIASLNEWKIYWDKATVSPSLILMDFHIPMTTGVELLQDLKQHPTYRSTPVVIWAGTANQEDVSACYEAGASSFIEKSSNLDELKQAMKSLYAYWFTLVRLP